MLLKTIINNNQLEIFTHGGDIVNHSHYYFYCKISVKSHRLLFILFDLHQLNESFSTQRL